MIVQLATTLILAALGLACSTGTEPTVISREPALPKACKEYDASRGGVQISCIYRDENVNRDSVGRYDEWIVLRADGRVNTNGWKLHTGDPGQFFALPDAINGSLLIYTVQVPDTVGGPAISIGRASGGFVWNDEAADSARVFDSLGALVDIFIYTPE